MNATTFKAWLSCLIIGGLVISGCTAHKKTVLVPYPSMEPHQIAMRIMHAETTLSRRSSDNICNKEKADLLLRLIMLHTHPDNPDPNYSRAIDYLQQYAKLGQPVHAEYALSLLTRLSGCLCPGNTTCSELLRQKAELEIQCRELTRENLYHKEVIEKLKSLDIQLEKKRKSFD